MTRSAVSARCARWRSGGTRSKLVAGCGGRCEIASEIASEITSEIEAGWEIACEIEIGSEIGSEMAGSSEEARRRPEDAAHPPVQV